jgi:diguanylate cyclase (GGDEF)-like protein
VSGPERAGWANQQLIEFLARVAGEADEVAALQTTVEVMVEAVEAEVGVFVVDGAAAASIGFARGAVPEPELLRLGDAHSSRPADLPGLGPCWVVTVPVAVRPGAVVLVARCDDDFGREEVALLRGMGRVLELVVSGLRNLAGERVLREQGDRLGEIQRLIAARAGTETVIDAVVDATVDLVGDEVVGLRLVDRADPRFMDLVVTRGLDDVEESARRTPVTAGIGGQAVAEGRLVVWTDYEQEPTRMEEFVRLGVTAAMGAPLLGPDGPMGSLVVASRRPGRVYSDRDRTVLLALAEHAKLALNDARAAQALREALDAATHQAMHDLLTGLPNRALFLDRLDHALARASRNGSTLAVVFVDVDEFKLVNDNLGHDTGDALLRGVAVRLQSAIRASDTAARLGGDEFALLLEDLEPGGVTACAERVLAALSDPQVIGGRRLLSRASLGIAVSVGGDRDAGGLLREADVAMYQAKAQGKNRYVVFEPAMQERVRQRMELELDLHRAMESGEFVLFYQPVVDLRSEDVTGLEALVRWNDPGRGLVPPAEFIPLAEETGLMVPLGSWVLHEACRTAAAWRRDGVVEQDLCLAVNISARQLRDAGFLEDVRSALSASGLPPAALKLELTESALISDTDAMVARLTELKELGVALSIDDFGTGYSSLGYLRRFPVDELKIDKSFVDDLLAVGTTASLAEVVVALGATLGMDTVAEGVETVDQVDALRRMGCGRAQGYYFHRPMPAAAIEQLLAPASARAG